MNHAAKNPPIKLEGASCLMYNDIAEFMGTNRRILTVNRDLATNVLNDGAADVLTRNEGGADLEATLDVEVRLGDRTYSAIKSTISFLYRQSGIERPMELRDEIIIYCKGSKRKGILLKQDTGLDISDGKKQIPQEVFRFLANKLFTSKKKENIFAHLILILDW